MTTSSPLAGKRALVTGGARGIGDAIALKLAQDGADVALTYEKSDKAEALAAEIRALGRKAVAIQADAASLEASPPWTGPSPTSAGWTFWSTTPAWPASATSWTSPWPTSTSS